MGTVMTIAGIETLTSPPIGGAIVAGDGGSSCLRVFTVELAILQFYLGSLCFGVGLLSGRLMSRCSWVEFNSDESCWQ